MTLTSAINALIAAGKGVIFRCNSPDVLVGFDPWKFHEHPEVRDASHLMYRPDPSHVLYVWQPRIRDLVANDWAYDTDLSL